MEKDMKTQIEEMIAEIKSGQYDPEGTHLFYEQLLEEFIQNYDPTLLPLMKELIELPKGFWYA